jgi:hypothetical protein
MHKRNRHIGSSLADLQPEESILVDARAVAIEEALAFYFRNDPSDKSAEKERN